MLVTAEYMPTNTLVFGSRFVDELKKSAIGVLLKNWMVAQNYAEEGSDSVDTNAPTVHRFFQRLLFTLFFYFTDMTPFVRDISLVYTQYEADLEREGFINQPQELDLPP